MTARRGSILLNSPAQSPALLPQHLPSYPPSTISSASSCDMHIYRSSSAPTPSRRIRFAPLPETTIETTSTPTRTESPISVRTQASSPTPCPSISSTCKPKSESHFLRRLSIFKRSPLSSPTNPSLDPSSTQRFSTEDVTLRFLRRPRTPELGPSLSRISSAREPKRPSTAPDTKSRSSINSPGSGGGRHAMPPKSFVSPPSSPTSSPLATVPKKFGMRMLNGRVYGSRRHTVSSNPFANVREEPEFVEWGYGGMGSVNGSSNSKYSVLATGSPALLSHTQPQTVIVGGGRGGAASAAVERQDAVARAVDEDDGSGMGWVRRRREERERLAREKEAQERRASAEARRSGELSRSSLDNSPSIDTYSRRTSTDGSSALDTASTDVSTLAASSAPTTPPSTTDTLPELKIEDEQGQHILQAIRLSPKHTHHHHHPHSHQDLVVGTTIGILGSDKSDQSPTSETSSDADGEEEIPKEDDDEDSEVEQTEDQRKTSLGAGVEKISRHKEVAHGDR